MSCELCQEMQQLLQEPLSEMEADMWLEAVTKMVLAGMAYREASDVGDALIRGWKIRRHLSSCTEV